MSYVDLDDAKRVVMNAYKCNTWREKVKRMPNKQILAIFFRLVSEPQIKEEKPKRINMFTPYVGEQLHF